jgi:hypothetical protein
LESRGPYLELVPRFFIFYRRISSCIPLYFTDQVFDKYTRYREESLERLFEVIMKTIETDDD